MMDVESFTTLGYSKGYLDGNYLDSTILPRFPVNGVKIAEARCGITNAIRLFHSFKVVRVVSPFEFYMEYEVDPVVESRDVHDRYEKMQERYSSQEANPRVYRINVTKFRVYAYYDEDTKAWWRVRVHDIDEAGKRAFVHYCESARQEYIQCGSLRNIEEEFLDWGTPRCRCYLYDIRPLSSAENAGRFHWSMEAVMYFKELVESKCFNAIIMKWSQKEGVQYSPSKIIDCGVVLFSKQGSFIDSINYTMVKYGYAKTAGIMASSSTALYLPGMMPHFEYADKPQIKAAPSHINSRGQISREKLHEIVTRVTGEVGFSYFSKPIERVAPKYKPKVQRKHLPVKVRNLLTFIKMSFLDGPGDIFVHVQIKLKELSAVQQAIKNLKPRRLRESELKPGTFVSCETKDEFKRKTICFRRGVILKTNGATQKALVLMVDYGNRTWIAYKRIRLLPKKFRKIPSYVHRVHLSTIRPKTEANLPSVPRSKYQWNSYVNKRFFKYVCSHEKKKPLYFGYIPGNQNIVQLVDLDQHVAFDIRSRKWVAGAIPKKDDYKVINSLKEHPILASYFHSYPISIFYEVKARKFKPWKFRSLSKSLIKQRFATRIEQDLSKRKIHKIIVDEFDR